MLAEQKRLAKERAKEQRQLVSGSSTMICLACKQALLSFPGARKFEYLRPTTTAISLFLLLLTGN